MRGRRLQVFIGIVAAVVIAAVSVAVARIGGPDTTDVRAEGDRATTARLSDTVPATSTPEPEPPTTATTATPPTTSNGSSSGAPGPAPDGAGPGGAGAPPDPAVRAETCGASEVMVRATPDQMTYTRGEDVIVTASARNQGSRPCDPRDPSVEIRDEKGELAVRVGAADFTLPPVPWPPGGELEKPFTWNRTVCTDDGCRRATPGTYTATAAFGEYRSGPVTFTIL
jgi:hypothetical protein